MKTIHKARNWKQGKTTDLRGADTTYGLWYKNAPVTRENEAYPPITWRAVCGAYGGTLYSRSVHLNNHIPQVWVGGCVQVLAFVWEVCARYEYGEFDDCTDNVLIPVRALVCEVHQHLGSSYNDFVIGY